MSYFSEIVRVAEARYVEVDNPNMLAKLFHFHPTLFSEQYMQKLEDRIMDMSEQMTGVEIVNVSQQKEY